MTNILTGKSLHRSSKVLCIVYGAIAVVALVATWSQMIPYTHSVHDSFVTFWRDTKVTAGSRFITADILMFGLAAAFLMVTEARRHNIRFVWAYIAAAYIVAVSVAFPLFLIARELRIGASSEARTRPLDAILLSALAVGGVALTIWIDV